MLLRVPLPLYCSFCTPAHHLLASGCVVGSFSGHQMAATHANGAVTVDVAVAAASTEFNDAHD